MRLGRRETAKANLIKPDEDAKIDVKWFSDWS